MSVKMLVDDIKGMHELTHDETGTPFIRCTFNTNRTNMWIPRSAICENALLSARLEEVDKYGNWDVMEFGGRPKRLNRQSTTNQPIHASTPPVESAYPHKDLSSYSEAELELRLDNLAGRISLCKTTIDSLMIPVDVHHSDRDFLSVFIDDLDMESADVQTKILEG